MPVLLNPFAFGNTINLVPTVTVDHITGPVSQGGSTTWGGSFTYYDYTFYLTNIWGGNSRNGLFIDTSVDNGVSWTNAAFFNYLSAFNTTPGGTYTSYVSSVPLLAGQVFKARIRADGGTTVSNGVVFP